MTELTPETITTSPTLSTTSTSSAKKPSGEFIHWVLPSLGAVLFGGVLLGVALLGQVSILSGDGDTALHLRLGQEMITQRGLLPVNLLTTGDYGQPFIAWEWLSEVIFAGVVALVGLNGLVALVGLIVAMTAVLLLRAVRRRGTPLLLALPLTLAALALTSIHWLARPHIFSLLLTLWWSEQLWAYWQSDNPRKLWPFPFVLALWANLHSGYAVGLVLLGAATSIAWLFPGAASARDSMVRRRQLTRVFIACLLAALLTPWGLAGWLHILSFFSTGTAFSQVQEWASPDFHATYGKLFLILLLLLVACGVLRGWRAGNRTTMPADLEPGCQGRYLSRLAGREPGALGWTLAGIFTALALISVRAVPLWAVIVTPILGRELTSWTAEWATVGITSRVSRCCRGIFRRSWKLEAIDLRQRSAFWRTVVAVFVLMVVVNNGILPGSRLVLLHAQFSATLFPVEAVQMIQQGAIPGGTLPDGAGFTTVEWADYVEWALPHHLVMVDSRLDSFDESVLRDYNELLTAQPGWDQLISAYSIRWVLVPTTAPLAQIIPLAQGWLCQEGDHTHLALLCVPAPTLPVT